MEKLNLDALSVSILGNSKSINNSKTQNKMENNIEKITYERMIVTPAIAQEFLKHNTQNRDVSEGRVNLYAQTMMRGEWRDNGEDIIFRADGILADGQHRLLAIIKSGCSIMMGIKRGISFEDFLTLGTPARRSPAQYIKFNGENGKNGVLKAAIVQALHSIRSGTGITGRDGMVFSNKHSYNRMTNYQVYQFSVANNDILEMAISKIKHNQKKFRKYPIVVATLCALYLHLIYDLHHEKEKVDYFFEHLLSYDSCENKYVDALRIKFIKDMNSMYKIESKVKLNILYKTFNDYIINKHKGNTYIPNWKKEYGDVKLMPNDKFL